MDLPSFEEFYTLKNLCHKVVNDPNDGDSMKQIKNTIAKSTTSFIGVTNVHILSCIYPILKKISEKSSSFDNNHKQLIVDTLNELFKKFKLDKKGIFFNIYSFLLFEIYDHQRHLVLPISEEYKLSIMECMKSLASSVSLELVPELYTKENAPKFCQMLYVALEIAKKEQLRTLRISAIECILSIARVLNDDDFNDTVIREQVAEVFLFFIPGVASGLKYIALEDEKVGHKVPLTALKAWGRLVTLLMAHYGAPDEPFNVVNLKDFLTGEKIESSKNKKLKDQNDVKDYLESKKRTPQWYKETDSKMKVLVVEFFKLVHHSHFKVRLELVQMSRLLIINCYRNIPFTVSHLIEIVISLSEDEHDEVKDQSRAILIDLSSKFSTVQFKMLLENLEDGFFGAINRLPRKFNGIDEKEQLSALNLIIGYINLFGKYKLNDVLLSSVHLNKLMSTLLHISELEKSNVSLLEEYTIEDLELTPDLRTPWKNFKKFKDDSIKNKLEHLCYLLAQHGSFSIVSDFLLDIFLYNSEQRKEATFLLNGLILGTDGSEEHKHIIKNIVNTYINKNYWNLPTYVQVDEYAYEYTLSEVQDNVILICLLVEGIGKVALKTQGNFKEYMLHTLYLVFERAGSGNPLIRTAGLATLKNIAVASKYASITEMIIKNIDYLSFYVERNLNKIEENDNVLNVLSVILRYSKIEVLSYISEILNEVLLQSCDKFKEKNATEYLRIFNIFVQSLTTWLKIETKELPIKSKAQKEKEEQDFYVTGISKEETFSDGIMNKTAEEMYNEDMAKTQQEIEEESLEEEYKKLDPPLHIKLTVKVLGRSLHFLPSKDRLRKLLVLQILGNGLEIIRDWEDELLPIVHQIWSPLVSRFKEFNDPLIINYSFKLLITLGRLSKDFIRMRSQKDVLPSILTVLSNLSKESYLKDKGSAYRYTQSYKLQVTVLQGLGKLLIDLDVVKEQLNGAMDVVYQYLSDKQPLPLQDASVQFYLTLSKYDPEPVNTKLKEWITENSNTEFNKNVSKMCKILE